MAVNKPFLFAFLSLVCHVAVAQNSTDNLKYVDQLIGSANGGLSNTLDFRLEN